MTLKVSDGTNSDSITKTACINVSSYPSSMSLDFESLANFTLSFAPWTVIDVKGGNTYGIPGITFPNIYYPMSYICFNPAQTIPPLTIMQPHSGQKLGCCFSSVPSVPPLPATTPNDKWLISPKMSLGINARIEFWVKSYNTQYGNEMYNVSVSTTDLNPSSFVPLTTTPEASPADWTLRSYNLSAYTGQNVYIGIQCVTNDGFIFMLDDISITSTLGVDERPPLDRIMICPNPAGDHVTLKCGIKSQYGLRINLVSMLGDRIRSWNSADFSGTLTLDTHDIPGGMYILRIWDGTGKVDRKISIIN